MKSFSFIHAADLHLDVVLPLQRGVRPDSLNEASGSDGGSNTGHSGGAQLERAMLGLAREASFTAWRNLISLCLSEQVDFLLLAGDLYHQDDGSLKAYFALRDSFEVLRKAGIQVFIAHGNHDPLLPSAKAGQMPWPDNVRVFGSTVERFPVECSGENKSGRGERLALVHGVSHTGPAETQNLSKDFRRVEASLLEPETFQIGLLHCCIGKSDGHKAYAPCTLNDLCAAQLDYWALGHIHMRQEVCKRPAVHYPGSLQGLHINETGQHGCLLVRVDEKGHARSGFRPVAPLHWEILRLDLGKLQAENSETSGPEKGRTGADAKADNAWRDGSEAHSGEHDLQYDDEQRADLSHEPGQELNLDDLESLLVEKMHERAEESKSPLCQAVIFRLVLEGRSGLDSLLRKPGAAGELCSRLRAALQDSRSMARQGQPMLWVKDLRIQTSPERDLENLRNSEGFLGELLRYSAELGKDERNFTSDAADFQATTQMPGQTPGQETSLATSQAAPWAESLAALYEVKRNRKYLPDPPGPEVLARLVREAEEICLDKLGVD